MTYFYCHFLLVICFWFKFISFGIFFLSLFGFFEKLLRWTRPFTLVILKSLYWNFSFNNLPLSVTYSHAFGKVVLNLILLEIFIFFRRGYRIKFCILTIFFEPIKGDAFFFFFFNSALLEIITRIISVCLREFVERSFLSSYLLGYFSDLFSDCALFILI